MGLPVPEDIDGRVVQEIFAEEFVASHPLQIAPSSVSNAQPTFSSPQLSDKEDLKVKERLRALGYFD